MSEDEDREPIVPREKWGPGPWEDEPDRFAWRSQGFVCLAVRVPTSGTWCGYVAVPPGHPWYGVSAFDVVVLNDEEVDVHGGLTWGQTGCDEFRTFTPRPGESLDVHWLGFDTNHGADYAPARNAWMRELLPYNELTAMINTPYDHEKRVALEKAFAPELYRMGGGVYRTLAYVRGQVEQLAAQAARASGFGSASGRTVQP